MSPTAFADLGLPLAQLAVLEQLGHTSPTPIQLAAIPPQMAGRDIIGQAATGTGKTGAFALPMLAEIDARNPHPQALILAPTRELAMQVCEACSQYAAPDSGIKLLAVYGGASMYSQLSQLRRGAHIIVGTPGRVMDHLRRGTLKLDQLEQVVLDEADEMLRMGFIDDVEWILGQCPEQKRVSLFSATMPTAIKRLAGKYLNNPEHIVVTPPPPKESTIDQRFCVVPGYRKLDALTRVLEAEPHDGVIVFVRTKAASDELATALNAEGYAAAALNGDLPQVQRERTIERLRDGRINLLIATDVAARGLDVDRISHVINYDAPMDSESYVHRIGRTGRAGRQGMAILFIAPKEKHLLRGIEKATPRGIETYELPNTHDINRMRMDRFKQRIHASVTGEGVNQSQKELITRLLAEYQAEHGTESLDIAAALAVMLQGDTPLLLVDQPARSKPARDSFHKNDRPGKGGRNESFAGKRPRSLNGSVARYRVAVGRRHSVKPGQLVGAIANEAGLSGGDIGHIKIHDSHSTVELPDNLPADVLQRIDRAWVAGQQLCIRPAQHGDDSDSQGGPHGGNFQKRHRVGRPIAKKRHRSNR